MKLASILLLALGAINLATGQTAEVRLLTEKRDAAIAKIDSTYQAELAKLKLKYLASGDSAGADEVTKLLGGSTDAAPAVDPVIGRWKHQYGHVWTFKADGSISCDSGDRGVWKAVKTSALERKYAIQWSKGRGVIESAGEMGRDTKSMKFKHDTGTKVDLTRLEDF